MARSRHQAPFLLLALPLGLASVLGGCQLDEVSVALPQDVPVAEAFVLVGDGEHQATAFLHWTLGTRPARDLVASSVALIVEDTLEVFMFAEGEEECLLPRSMEEVDGICFTASDGLLESPEPGTRLKLKILFPGGGELQGGTVIPQDIQMLRPGTATCALPPGRNLEMVWSRSPGAWAYYAEATIWNLKHALAPMGIVAEADSVALLGLAISESDTTIVFPRQFGVFSRGVLQQEVALALQEGLPAGALAEVTVAALDRNWVNWVRGGSFNPSGTVRIPSLRGDGFGVFGSGVRRKVTIVGGRPRPLAPNCFGGFF